MSNKMGGPLQIGLTPNSLADQTGKTGQQRRVFAALWDIAEGS